MGRGGRKKEGKRRWEGKIPVSEMREGNGKGKERGEKTGGREGMLWDERKVADDE